MTVSSTTRSVSFSCNGSTKAFDFPFKIFEESDVRVFVRDSDGEETELTYTTHFEVSNNTGNFDNGGTVTTVSYSTGARVEYAWPSGNTLIIVRDLTRTQESDYINNQAFDQEGMEDDLDRLTMLIQEVDETLLRALVGPIEDGAGSMVLPSRSTRSGCYLGFDSNGKPVAIAGAVSSLAVSSFMSSMLLYGSAEEFMEGIGLDPDVLDFSFSAIGAAVASAETAADAMTAIGMSLPGQSIVTAATAAAARTALGVAIGTDVMGYDAELAAIAGLVSEADRGIYFTGSGTASLFTLTAFARTLLDDATAAAARATLGVSTLSDASAGNYLEHSIGDCGGGVQTEGSYEKVSEFYLTRGGTYRVVFTLTSGDGAAVYGRIYRNGAAVGTERSSIGATFSEDISGWSAGDLCQLYLKGKYAAATGSAFKVCSAAPMNSAIRQIANVSS